MGVLWEIKGQYERFSSCVLDFHTAAFKCGLGDEADLGIEFAEDHILVISDFELSNTTGSAIGVKQRGALGAKIGLATGLDGEPKD